MVLCNTCRSNESNQRLIFEEGMVALHSGISLESSLTAADQARLTLDQMEKINMEPDLLTKLENGNGNTQIWLNYKSMTMERLNDKLMRVNK